MLFFLGGGGKSSLSLFSGAISIILQTDFHWLRPQIFPEIPNEEELFHLLSVCFLYYELVFFFILYTIIL